MTRSGALYDIDYHVITSVVLALLEKAEEQVIIDLLTSCAFFRDGYITYLFDEMTDQHRRVIQYYHKTGLFTISYGWQCLLSNSTDKWDSEFVKSLWSPPANPELLRMVASISLFVEGDRSNLSFLPFEKFPVLFLYPIFDSRYDFRLENLDRIRPYLTFKEICARIIAVERDITYSLKDKYCKTPEEHSIFNEVCNWRLRNELLDQTSEEYSAQFYFNLLGKDVDVTLVKLVNAKDHYIFREFAKYIDGSDKELIIICLRGLCEDLASNSVREFFEKFAHLVDDKILHSLMFVVFDNKPHLERRVQEYIRNHMLDFIKLFITRYCNSHCTLDSRAIKMFNLTQDSDRKLTLGQHRYQLIGEHFFRTTNFTHSNFMCHL
jgi:hypothetical protein